MRLERNSLIAIALLFMAGCSAHRLAPQSDNVSDVTDPVRMPIRHADEFEFQGGDHEYNPAPSSGDRSGPSRTPVQPSGPMREPVSAPPAVGFSRVKSVSWLRGEGRSSESNNCGDVASGDGCSTGHQTHLPPDYFADGCGTPHAATTPRVQFHKRSGASEGLHGWHLREKTHRRKRVQSPFSCGEGTARDPGFILPEGCNSSVKDRNSTRHSPPVVKQYIGGVAVDPGSAPPGNHRSSLADPLQDDGWDDHGGSRDQRYSPDELLDVPSSPETPTKRHPPENVPDVPIPAPALAVPESPTNLSPTPAIQPTDAPAVPQQINPGAMKRIVQPPMWPRLGSAAATYGNAPAVTPAVSENEDASLPTIQPGRSI